MSKGKFALGALFGVVVGAIAGLLTAPKSGKETIKDLKAKASEISSDVTKKAETVTEATGDVVAEAKIKVHEVMTDARTNIDELKDRAERAIDGAKKGFTDKK
jgi:gas vesicle protein